MKRSRGKRWIAELIVMLMIFTTGLGSIHVKAAGNEEPAKTQTLTQNGIRMQFTETAPGSDLLDVSAESVDGTKVIDSIEANGEMHAGTSFTFQTNGEEKTEFSVHYHETGTAASGNELTVASANNGDEEEAGGALPDAVIGLPGLRALAAPAAEAEDGVETFTFIPEFAALVTHKVTLDVNGGENYPSTTFDWPNGMTLPEPDQPVRTGFTFAGWHEIDETTIRLWNFDIDTVTRDITLVAGWDPIPSELVTVEAKKVLLDQNNNDISSQLKDGEFTFRLTADRSASGNIPQEISSLTATNAADGSIRFSIPKAALDTSGIVVYEMTEDPGSEPGVTYNPDGQHYYVAVGDGLTDYGVQFFFNLADEGPIDPVPGMLNVFVNRKDTEAADQNITVNAKKVLLDQNDNDLMSQLKDGEFTFRLKAVRSLFVDSLNETNSEFTATNTADGSISFAIPKTAIIDDDIIIYEMTEDTGSEAGITYNPTGLHYYVAVGGKTDNYEVQYFETLAEDGPTDPLPADMVLFLNRKNTESADQNITVSAKKVLQDQNGSDISSQLQNGEFTFRLTADRSLLNALTEANRTFTATNAADGSISFAIPKTAIEDTDIIIYEMTEDAGSEAGVTYNPDGAHYYVVVGGKASSYTVQYYATLTTEGPADLTDAAKVAFTNRKNVTPVNPTEPTNPTNPTNPTKPGSSGSTGGSSGGSSGSGRRVAGNAGTAGPGVSSEAAAESSPEDTGEPNDNSGNAAELNQSVPKTADPLPVLPLLTLMLGSGAGMLFLDRRKMRTK